MRLRRDVESVFERSESGGTPTGASRLRGAAARHAGNAARGHAAEILAAQDEERRRIARELHDGAVPTLVALSLELTRLVERAAGESRELASSCAALCEESLRALRSAAFVLHPPPLERDGLAVALRHLVEGFGKRSGIHVTFHDATAPGERLPRIVELALYRIAQEALTNVLRHSGSRTARVTLAARPGGVRLTVQDHGRRRARRKDGAGVGLASMRERVGMLGGCLTFAVHRQGGTVLRAMVPVVG
jgi:two-component system NarL family sensor kinase